MVVFPCLGNVRDLVKGLKKAQVKRPPSDSLVKLETTCVDIMNRRTHSRRHLVVPNTSQERQRHAEGKVVRITSTTSKIEAGERIHRKAQTWREKKKDEGPVE